MGYQRAFAITNYDEETYNRKWIHLVEQVIRGYNHNIQTISSDDHQEVHDTMRVEAFHPMHADDYQFFVLANQHLQTPGALWTNRASELINYHANHLLHGKELDEKNFPKPKPASNLEEAVLVGSILLDYSHDIIENPRRFAKDVQRNFQKRLELNEEENLYISAHTKLAKPLTRDSEAIYVQHGNQLHRIDAYSNEFALHQQEYPAATKKDLEALSNQYKHVFA